MLQLYTVRRFLRGSYSGKSQFCFAGLQPISSKDIVQLTGLSDFAKDHQAFDEFSVEIPDAGLAQPGGHHFPGYGVGQHSEPTSI